MPAIPYSLRLACFAILLTAAPAAADGVTWIGTSSGNWTSANWSPHAPGTGDDVYLGFLASPNQANNYTVTVQGGTSVSVNSVNLGASTATLTNNGGTGATFTAAAFNLSAGQFNQLSGSLSIGNLSVTGGTFTLSGGTATLGFGGGTVTGGTFAFSNGTLNGAALNVSNGGFTWDNGTLQTTINLSNGGALISGLGTKILDAGSQLNLNGGTTTFVGAISYIGNGSVTVAGGATLNIQSDMDVQLGTGYSGPATFTIAANATVIKTVGNGVAQFHSGLTMSNAGTIRTSSAVLEVDSSVTNSGTIQADATTEFRYVSGTLTLNTGSAFAGGGTIHLLGGTATAAIFDVEANTAAAAATTVSLETGTIQGIATLTINGPLNWKSAVIGGSATVIAASGGTVIGSGGISTGTMNLTGGAFTWSTGNITFSGSGQLNIGTSATLSNTSNNTFSVSSGSPTVQNDGTLEKIGGTGGMTVPAGLMLNSTGTLRVTSGTITVTGGVVNNSGAIIIGTGSELFVDGGTVNLNAGSVITGAGLLHVDSSNSILAVNATVNSTTGLNYVRGTINGTGMLNLGGPFNFGLFDTNSVSGTVTINASDGGAWTSGTPHIGSGTVNLTGGTFTLAGANITFVGSGALTVGPAATLQLTDDHAFSVSSGSPSVTVNGLLQKSGGTSNSTIPSGLAFSIGSTGTFDLESGTIILQANTANAGLIQIGTGTLSLNLAVTFTGSGTISVLTAGTFSVAPGSANTITVPAGMTFASAGLVQATSGTLRFDPLAVLSNYTPATGTLAGGTWKATGATLDFSGRAINTISAGTTVEVSGSSAAVIGLTSLTQNNGSLRIYNSATLNPLAAVGTAGTTEISGTLGSATVVQNGGTLAGKGTITGAVTVQSGGVIAPGPGPYAASGVSILTVGGLNLNGGGSYAWELNSWSATPAAGSSYDQIRGSSGATMNLAGASSTNTVTLKIISLNGTAAGLIPSFDSTMSRSWVIADFSSGNASGGLQNFAAGDFMLDTSLFQNAPNSTAFSLSTDIHTNQLILTFTAAPEPAGILAFACLLLVIGAKPLKRPDCVGVLQANCESRHCEPNADRFRSFFLSTRLDAAQLTFSFRGLAMLLSRNFALLVAILALGGFAGTAQAAKGLKKTGEEKHTGVVTAVNHNGKEGTFTIKTHGHKKGAPAGTKTATHTKTFKITTSTQFHSVQNKQKKAATAKSLKKGAHVVVMAKSEHAEHVEIHHHTKSKVAVK